MRFSLRAAASIAAAALIFGLGSYWGSRSPSAPPPPPFGSQDFSASVEALRPSVAQIIADQPRELAPDPSAEYPNLFPSPERGAFPFPLPPGSEAPLDEEEEDPASSIGSAFFISSDGYLLTNAHVVAGSRSIIIRLADRSEVPARLIGTDSRSDIALLKADGPGPYVPAPIGNPSDAKVGEWVLAIGSPFGFEASATVGVLSAKGRFLPDGSFLPFLQTDAAINPGNSGGPLFNAKGQVIGINSEIYSRSGGYMGLSFAIPIDQALLIADKLKSSGRVVHGRIGAVVQDMTPSLAEALGAPGRGGAIILEADPDGPAGKSGLLRGDAVISYAGVPLDGSPDFVRRVAQSDPGSEIALEVLRSRKIRPMKIRIGGEADFSSGGSGDAHQGPALSLLPLPPEKAQRIGLSSGLEILEPGDRGFFSGLRSGDILVTANGSPLLSPEDFQRALRESAKTKSPVALLVWRDGSARFLAYR